MKKFSLSLTLISSALLAAVALASPAGSGYHLIKKVPLGAAPGGKEYFDYVTVDSDARRVYLAHGAEVKVIDADNFSLVGTVTGLKRCHGVVVLPELGKGFITDGDGANVTVFDLKNFKITNKIKSAKDTDSVVYDPASKLIFSFNGDSANSTVIDPIKETVVKVIDMGGAVEQGVTDGKGLLYDNNEEKNDMAVVDTAALTIKGRWPVAPAGTPVAIAIDREHRRIFSSGRKPQFVVMMDADSGKVLQSLPISSGADGNVFDPDSGLLFVATRAGKLHIFHEDSPEKLTEVKTLDTEYGAKTMNIDPKTHNLFLSTADFGPAPAAATKENPKSARKPIPGTFHVLVYGR